MPAEVSFLLPTSIPLGVSLAEAEQSGRMCPHRNTMEVMKSLGTSLKLGVCHSLTRTSPFLLTLEVCRSLGAGAEFAMFK